MMTMTGSIRLAAVLYETGFRIDDFLAGVVDQLRAEQVIIGGALQENARDAAGLCSAMTLIDLTTQHRLGISQALGTQAEGCRLDPHGLTEMGALLDRNVGRNVELLILNRFGKAEAEGRGLRSVFARGIEAGVPILTAVRPPYTQAWSEFHGGLAADLRPDIAPVVAWCLSAVRELRVARGTELPSAG
jgi:Protein of unknown function (DUF2478)